MAISGVLIRMQMQRMPESSKIRLSKKIGSQAALRPNIQLIVNQFRPSHRLLGAGAYFVRLKPIWDLGCRHLIPKTDIPNFRQTAALSRIAAVHPRKMLQLPANVRFGEAALQRRELA